MDFDEYNDNFGTLTDLQILVTECHNKEHSDLFDYTTYLPQILGPGHGQGTSAK